MNRIVLIFLEPSEMASCPVDFAQKREKALKKALKMEKEKKKREHLERKRAIKKFMAKHFGNSIINGWIAELKRTIKTSIHKDSWTIYNSVNFDDLKCDKPLYTVLPYIEEYITNKARPHFPSYIKVIVSPLFEDHIECCSPTYVIGVEIRASIDKKLYKKFKREEENVDSSSLSDSSSDSSSDS